MKRIADDEQLKLSERLALIKDILSILVPMGSYPDRKESDASFINKVVKRVCDIEGMGEKAQKCKEELKTWITFYKQYFPNRKFIYTQAFLNTEIIDEFLSSIGYLYGVVFLDIKKELHSLDKYYPLQLYDSNAFLYFKMMNEWHKKQEEYFEIQKDDLLDYTKKNKNDLWDVINKKYDVAKKKESAEDVDWPDLFKVLDKKCMNNEDYKRICSFLLIDIFDYRLHHEFYKKNREEWLSKLETLQNNCFERYYEEITIKPGDIISQIHGTDIKAYLIPVSTELITLDHKEDHRERLIAYCLVFFKSTPNIKEIFSYFRDFMVYTISPSVINIQLKLEEEYRRDVLRHAMRTAVVAIMGRNMSHNIGSHVLANIIEDDDIDDIGDDSKKLFKFLQHRMDFIAQISTTTPAWTIDIKLEDIVGNFNKQKHLKNYIAYFRKLKSKDIIVGFTNKEDKTKEVAIPTGEIGCHAIYSIMENIIRNAARHGMQDRQNKLELSISVDDSNWRFYKITIKDNCKNGSKEAELNVLFRERIIDDKGGLIRKAWGLKEEKIMASYLRLLSQDEVDEKYESFASNAEDSDEPPIIKSISDKDGNLAYEFFLLKPKKIFIVSDRSWEHKTAFKAEGIDIINANTFEHFNRFNRKSIIHKFLVIDMNGVTSVWFQENILKHLNSLPFRILIVGNTPSDNLPKNIVFLSSLPEMNEPSEFYNKIWEGWVSGFYHSSHKLVLRTDAPIGERLIAFISCIKENVDKINKPKKAVLLDHRKSSDLTSLYKNVACHIPFGSEEALFKVLQQIPDSQFLMHDVLEMGITKIAIMDDRIWKAKAGDISAAKYSAKSSRALLNLWKKKE